MFLGGIDKATPGCKGLTVLLKKHVINKCLVNGPLLIDNFIKRYQTSFITSFILNYKNKPFRFNRK